MVVSLRFLRGAAEAGLYPCLVFYIALWLPRADLARGVGMLTIGSAIGNGAGALISGPLLDLDGMLGLAGWQRIFLITGAIPVIGGIVILRYMRDGIDDATYLTDAEKADLADRKSTRLNSSH